MSAEKVKVRSRELWLIQLFGIPAIRMLIGIFKKFAEKTQNEYDDQVVVFLEGLLVYLVSDDFFEIT